MGHLDGRIAVVTGAGNGIGREHALLMAREGARVVVNDTGGSVSGEGNDEGVAARVAREIADAGGEAVANSSDVASAAGAESLVQQAVDTYGGLDILVNNAGILRDRTVVNMTEDDWDSVIRVHLRGHFCPLRSAASYWRNQAEGGQVRKAAVINTSSTSGLRGNFGQSNYGAAKAGITALTVIADQELRKFGVRVNAIAPGARTRMTENLSSRMPAQEGTFDSYSPANVAPLVAYLARAETTEHGRVYFVSGGYIGLFQPWHVVADIEKQGQWEVGELTTAMSDLDIELQPTTRHKR